MKSTMMDFQLTLAPMLERAGTLYPKVEIVSRRPDRSLHRCTYLDLAMRVRTLARALIAANPDRVLWGSNWPHPSRGKTREDFAPPYPSDDGAQINQLPNWTSDPAIRKKILVDNPARLYGFPAA